MRAPESLRAVLMAFYTSLADPVPAIEALLGIGDSNAAFELFRRGGGPYYGYLQGYHALERVLALFGPELEQRSEEIFLARLWMLVKTGKTREALLRLDARHPGLPVDHGTCGSPIGRSSCCCVPTCRSISTGRRPSRSSRAGAAYRLSCRRAMSYRAGCSTTRWRSGICRRTP